MNALLYKHKNWLFLFLIYLVSFYVYIIQNSCIINFFINYSFFKRYGFTVLATICKIGYIPDYIFNKANISFFYYFAIRSVILICYVFFWKRTHNKFFYALIVPQFMGEVVFIFFYIVQTYIYPTHLKQTFYPSVPFFEYAMSHHLPDYTVFVFWILWALLILYLARVEVFGWLRWLPVCILSFLSYPLALLVLRGINLFG